MYIEIKKGLYVNANEIQVLEKIDKTHTRILLHHSKVEAVMPIDVLLQLVNREKESAKDSERDERIKRGMDKLLQNYPMFAG